MDNVWDMAGPLARGFASEGWEFWLERAFLPISVVIVLSNVSLARLLIGLHRRLPRRPVTRGLVVLLATPMLLCGLSLSMLLLIDVPYAGLAAGLLQAVAAIFWVTTTKKLTAAIARFSAPIAPRREPSSRELHMPPTASKGLDRVIGT